MASFAEQIRRHFIWLILAAYGVAALLPGPGAAAAQFDFGDYFGLEGRITLPLVLVAVLLYLAAIAVDVTEMRVLLRRPWIWIAGLACVWIGPAAALAIAGRLMPSFASEAAVGLLLGMALVAAMPVANSSVAWTQQAKGALPWSLGLVVLSILLTPWVTPLVIRVSGLSLAGADPELIEQATRSFSGAPFIVWVLLPTVAGFATRRLVGEATLEQITPARRLMSTAILLVLNYSAGSLAFREQPTIAAFLAAALAALALAAGGVLLATFLAFLFRLDRPTADALRFSLGMKHTGLAFGLATTAGLADQPAAMLLIVVTTPLQHVVAAIVDAMHARAEAGGE